MILLEVLTSRRDLEAARARARGARQLLRVQLTETGLAARAALASPAALAVAFVAGFVVGAGRPREGVSAAEGQPALWRRTVARLLPMAGKLLAAHLLHALLSARDPSGGTATHTE